MFTSNSSVLGLASLASSVAACLALVGCSHSFWPEPEARASAAAPHAASDLVASSGQVTRAVAAPRGKGVAVVELFTSEGCSSCPPADQVLSRLAARATASSLSLYTLSFHVDYWNYLGWRDRFSSSSYSERQRGYASINPNGGTYTPQAVVNGEAECVGSNAEQLDSYVTAALAREPRTQVELEARRVDGGIEVTYRVSGATTGRVLNLALVEPRAESAVKSGENAGERLAHVNVVRAFTSRVLGAGNAGTWAFAPSADFGTQRVGVVGYAEDTTQRDISGAAALELD